MVEPGGEKWNRPVKVGSCHLATVGGSLLCNWGAGTAPPAKPRKRGGWSFGMNKSICSQLLAGLCVVEPACTRTSPCTSSFWLFLSSSEDVSENQRFQGLKKRKKKLKICACEGKAENVNSQCELAEIWGCVLCALGCCSVRGRALQAQSWLHPCPLPWNSQPGMCPGDKCLCCRDTEALSKLGLGPSSPCWGHWASSGLAGTGAGSHTLELREHREGAARLLPAPGTWHKPHL